MSIEDTFQALKNKIDGVAAIRAELDAVLQQFVASPEGRSIRFKSGKTNELPGGVYFDIGVPYNEELSGKAYGISLAISAQGRVEISRDLQEELGSGETDWWQDKSELSIDVGGRPSEEAARILGELISSHADVVGEALNKYVARRIGYAPGLGSKFKPEI